MNAYPAGSSCSHIAKNSEQTSIETVIKYSSCRCDRAIYKEDIKNCEDYDSNKVCTDSDSNQYTSSCVCNRDKYPMIAWDCEYGGEGEECVEDGITYVEDCCSCSGFPLKQLESGYQNCSGGCDKITKVEPCSCDHGKDMVKVVQCAAGWQPTSDRDGCERISCEAAVKLYMSKYPNDGYGLLEVIGGVTSIGYYEPLTDDERNALTGDDLATATYAVSDRWKETNFSTGVMYKHITASKKGVKSYIGGSSAKTIMSAYAFANSLTGDTEEVNMVKGSCNTSPYRQYTYAVDKEEDIVNNIASTDITYTINDVGLYINGSNGKFYGSWDLTDSRFESSVDVTFNRPVTLTADEDTPTEDTPTFGSSGKSYTFSSSLTSSGYNFSYKNLILSTGKITLPSNGSMSGDSIYINNTKGFEIYGPESNAGMASIKSSIYLGYDTSKRIQRFVPLKLYKYVTLNLGDTKSVFLSTGSTLQANNPAKITTSGMEYHDISAKSYQPLPYNQIDPSENENGKCRVPLMTWQETLPNYISSWSQCHGRYLTSASGTEYTYGKYSCANIRVDQYASNKYNDAIFVCKFQNNKITLVDAFNVATGKIGANFSRSECGSPGCVYEAANIEITNDCKSKGWKSCRNYSEYSVSMMDAK